MLCSGCSFFEATHPPNGTPGANWQAYLAASEHAIKKGAFEDARHAAEQMEDEIRAEIPPDAARQDVRLKQLRIQQALLEEILLNQSRQQFLMERMDKNWQTLQQTNQSVTAMKKRVAALNTKMKRLEQEKKRLEKQIERMKQIDLK